MRISQLLRFAVPGRKPPGDWGKSSLSMHNGSCVEVAGLDGDVIWLRDSKHPDGRVMRFPPAEWDAFVSGARNGEFDRKSGH